MAAAADYVPTAAGAKLGSSGENVKRLQNYLTRFGYFAGEIYETFGMEPVGAVEAPDKLGDFDEHTAAAVRKLQEFNGLPVTGELDEATLALTAAKRCGFPDLGQPKSTAGGLAEFSAQGNKWSTTGLRYGFVNYTGDLTQSQIRAAVSTALGYWAAVTPLTFTEVANSANPEIRISFVTGNHGDGSPFDGAGKVLAHAFFPPPNGGDIAGDSHFDDAESWTVNLPPSGIDLYTVAAHEFGHALGLNHSSVNGALMYPYYGGAHRFLHADDIAGIQSIYGVQQWHAGKKILRVFASYHAKNAWAFIEGLGWRKLRPAKSDGVTNMFAGFCDARANDLTTTVLVTENTIEQMYV